MQAYRNLNLGDSRFLDLTHALQPEVPTWSGSCGFSSRQVSDYSQGCRVDTLAMTAGIGTHMDAPLHFMPQGKAIADIELTDLILPICRLDIAAKAQLDYLLSVEDISEYEASYGKIMSNSLVIIYTGWSRHWDNPEKYRSAGRHNVMHFPAISAAAAQLMVERGVAGVGIDTLSPDSSDSSFPVHHILLGAGKYIIENIANADRLPAVGAYALVMPLKISNGTESPIRLVALLPNSS